MNLNEFVEQTYLDFLHEQESEEYSKIKNDYFKLVEAMSAAAEWIDFASETSLNEDISVGELNTQVENLKTLFQNLGGSFKPEYKNSYVPEADMMKKMTVADNIRMFLTTIIQWIQNIVIRVIDFFKRMLSTVTGLEYKPVNKEDKTLEFSALMDRAKKVAQVEKEYHSFGPLGNVDLSNSKVRAALGVEDEKFKNVIFDKINHESVNLTEREEEPKHEVNIPTVYIDPSKDLSALREAINHFFKLFDESIGSNGERLYETADLGILFKNFKAVKKALEDGDTTAYADLGGGLMKLQIVSPDRLKDNLIRTNVNVQKLNNAYKEVQNIINRLLEVIMQKNYQSSVILPETFKFLSSASYKQMAEIIKVLDSRIATSKKLEKALGKMQDNYMKLTKELENIRGEYMQLGSNYYAPSILQKEIGELFVSAKYVTQTIMLRFASLGLYTKILRDTRATIANLNSLNKVK